jgi:hypothetical protein
MSEELLKEFIRLLPKEKLLSLVDLLMNDANKKCIEEFVITNTLNDWNNKDVMRWMEIE